MEHPGSGGAEDATASEYFGRMVDRYDSLIRRAVPRYDEMHERLVECLPRAASRVLELGCGTGNLTRAVRERYPEDEIASLLEHAGAHDHYVPVREHFRMLEDAGFRDLDCVWRSGIWGILCAERA